MDPVTITTFLAPFLPYLLKAGEKAAEETGKQLGENFGAGTWDKAKALWSKFQPKVETKPLAQGAAQELANSPEDEDAKDTLSKQLKKFLDEDKSLASEVAQLMQENADIVSKVVKISQQVRGNKNIVIGQSDGSVNIKQN